MTIPLLDLKKQYQSIKQEIDARISKILESGRFILGPEVSSLEAEVADFCQAKYAIGVASGTDALELALRALGVKAGDEVITTPFTFIATTEAITQVGAKVVFVDIRLDTYNIDPEKIREKITPRSKVIIPVHLYGQPCDVEEIMEIARENNLLVIEDCAQAIGAEYKGKKVGSFGDIGCFSFFPSKNLGGYGDGGMCTTEKEELAEKLRMLRVHGSKNKYQHITEGRNSRLDEIQAGILRIKLQHLNQWNQQRREKARLYTKMFKESGLADKVILPVETKDVKHVFNLYVIRVRHRDELLGFLKSKEIFAAVHYPIPLHLQEVYKQAGHKIGDFPNAELTAREIISLPFFPEISEEQISAVVESIKEFLESNN
ncbi:MAG: DegT/DnrJ/EryC1/StrS family aminotransferase [Candidatus Omnitrophica bacterium]|nr:DegT/DnrJ/EryC1/StrS family aminotransferase [Candidatus Omnitrophota bacterium]